MDENYHQKMEVAFNWFLGNNRLQQIIYNPCTVAVMMDWKKRM